MVQNYNHVNNVYRDTPTFDGILLLVCFFCLKGTHICHYPHQIWIITNLFSFWHKSVHTPAGWICLLILVKIFLANIIAEK